MQLRILGCSGGISPGQGTTSFLVDQTLLIDAGTGVEALERDEMLLVESLVLTHSHLDHICHLPFLLNNIISESQRPLQVFGLQATIDALKAHVFNDVIWPDFTKIPSVDKPAVVLNVIKHGDELMLGNKKVVALPVNHAVPATGYWVGDDQVAFAFSGDSAKNDVFWPALNALPEADMLIMDNQYLESEQRISDLAKHYYPGSLKDDLAQLSYRPHLFITHLPPHKKQEVMSQIEQALEGWQPMSLEADNVYHLPLAVHDQHETA